ncbi:MAG: paraquat-inducible protein A [Motiliproteus sp.]
MAEFQTIISPKQLIFLRVLLVISLITLIAGVLLPIITIEKFYLVENTFSILSGVIQLFIEKRYFLFLLLGFFSILMPILKLGVLYQILDTAKAQGAHTRRYLHWMHLYGKWSMLDVFVVAMLVVSVKLGAIASVEIHAGLYAFAASVLLTMLITARVVTITADLP